MAGETGGCMCRAVRYRLDSEPDDCGWCHCRLCQLASGAPAMVFATVPDGKLAWTEGADAVHWVQSTSFGRRAFCGRCGTALLMKVEYQPDTVDFAVATLDEPDAVRPGYHIFWANRVAWFDPADDLPRYEKFRPNTVGLEGTEPPGG